MYVSGEFQDKKPAVFNQPGLENLVYLETRRTRPDIDPLSGNLGPSPFNLGEQNYELTGSHLSYEEWRKVQLGNIATRLQNAKARFGFDDIGYMRVNHGNTLINLDQNIRSVSINVPFADRAVADSSISTVDGIASLYAVGDCGIVTTVLPGAEAIIQSHVGIRGAVNANIPRTMAKVTGMGLDISDAYSYVAPLAHHFQMDKAEAEEIYELVANESDETKKEFLENIVLGPTGHPLMHISGIIEQQLIRSGIHPANIQISKESTLDNSKLFSHFDHLNKRKVNGRQGVLAGKTAPKNLR